MKINRLLVIIILLVITIGILIFISALWVPQNDPAYNAAITFVNTAAGGSDNVEHLLSPDLETYVAANCPDGRVSLCLQSYTPKEWGAFRSAVYRRGAPDGVQARDVELIATYESGTGASGVCIYNRVEQGEDGQWRVVGWAGFIHCGDPASRTMATNPDTPNRAP